MSVSDRAVRAALTDWRQYRDKLDGELRKARNGVRKHPFEDPARFRSRKLQAEARVLAENGWAPSGWEAKKNA